MSRILSAFSKLAFCFTTTGSISSFMKLVANTKRNSFGGNKSNSTAGNVADDYKLSSRYASRLLALRTFTGDIDIFYEVLWKKIYDRLPKDTEHIHTIIDLGANIGITALFFSIKYPNAKVYGIEPDPDNFELLLRNMKTEILAKRFFPIQAAIATHAGVAYIHKSGKAYNTTISADQVSALTVRTVELNSFFSSQNITSVDLLKIDIEGMELEIFSGDVSFLELVKNLVIECHTPATAVQCKAILAQHAFQVTTDNAYPDLLWGNKE